MERVRCFEHLSDVAGRLWLIVDALEEGLAMDHVRLLEIRQYESGEGRNFQELQMEKFKELIEKKTFWYVVPVISKP